VLFHLWFFIIAGFLLGAVRIANPRTLAGRLRVVGFSVAMLIAAQQWMVSLSLLDPFRWIGWLLAALVAAIVVLRSFAEEESLGTAPVPRRSGTEDSVRATDPASELHP
jgi:hypothetical protein